MKDIESAAQTYIITADCPSRTGTVDVVTRFLFEQQCYINEIHSFVDTTENRFFILKDDKQPRSRFAERRTRRNPHNKYFELIFFTLQTCVV